MSKIQLMRQFITGVGQCQTISEWIKLKKAEYPDRQGCPKTEFLEQPDMTFSPSPTEHGLTQVISNTLTKALRIVRLFNID